MPSAIRTQITIGRCVDCPFFERGVVGALADAVRKSPTKTGACNFNAGGLPFPLGRQQIPNAEGAPPVGCPLRNGDCLIQIKDGV